MSEGIIYVNVPQFVESEDWLELCQYSEEEEQKMLEKHWRIMENDSETILQTKSRSES